MCLKREFETTGNWLFRWRSYLPFSLLLLLVLAVPQFHRPLNSSQLQNSWEIFCLMISLSGLALRFFVGGHVAARTSGRNTQSQVAQSLNTTGIYSVVRHPLYVGNYLMWLGIAMFCFAPWVEVVFTFCFWLYYERIMFAEEAFLERQFGEEFTRWAAQTPAFIPRFSGYRPPALPFSLKTALRKEYTGLFGIAVAFALLDQFESLVITRQFSTELIWPIFLAASLMIYLVLMGLKKKTAVLRVPGR